MPATAVRFEHDANAPPEDVRVIVAVEVVTTLLLASSIFTTGCVESTAPDTPATGCVVKTTFVAGLLTVTVGDVGMVVSVPPSSLIAL